MLHRRPQDLRPPAWRWGLKALGALGPGLIGLVADNDAGGMTSYLLTGARHQLGLFLPALVLLGILTVFIQDMALRVGLATGRPFARVVTDRFGAGPARCLALGMHALNILVLATELSGMAMALNLVGIPFGPAVGAALLLVLALVSLSRYRTLERALLVVGGLNLAFLGSWAALSPSAHRVDPLRWAPPAGGTVFYLLALAGNAVCPWMVYWQQNAVVARGMRAWELRRGRVDLAAGVLAQLAMATAVLLLGAHLAGSPAGAYNPLDWLARQAGRASALWFALGVFDAGWLAAVTISLSSDWMLAEAFRGRAPGLLRRPRPAGHRLWWRRPGIRRFLALALAAGLVLGPGWTQGFLAVLTQALSAVLMPLTLLFLGRIADEAGRGPLANARWARRLWPAVAVLFFGLAAAAWIF
ncbi:MAG: divalent metal cation transporter [Actinomycetia bacterium]|nr:divalent metal cation transporter [Actinomycetes bacterium]